MIPPDKKTEETHLGPVVEARVAVTELVGLGLGEALESVVALASGTQAVLARAVEDAKDGEEEGDNLAAEVDGVAGGVLGGVGVDVGPAGSLSVSERKKKRKGGGGD
jgi:hypothetical protein